jgi:hypothetical protein
MGMAQNRMGRSRLTYLVIAGLFAQLFVTGLYAPAMALRSAVATVDGARTILICTGTGFKAVTLDDRGRPTKPAPDADQTTYCPICFGLAGCHVIEPGPVAIAQTDPPAPPRLSAIAFQWPPNGPPARPTSRGPPA